MRLIFGLLCIATWSLYESHVCANENSTAPETTESHVTLRRSACRCQRCFVAETSSFRVHCCSTAERIKELAISCERLKSHCQATWVGDASTAWDTKCEVVVHATMAAYCGAMGPGSERTSGCSTIQLEKGRVLLRRIDLCGSAEGCFTDSLPHELTHVVLADQFTDRRIPQWADEGIAMLAESPDKLQRRLNELQGVVAMNRTMGLHELMKLDQGPPVASRDAFYGQSVTVTGVLLERGTPEQLIRFVKAGQRQGYEHALREIYAIESWSEFESEWQNFAGSQRLRMLAHHSIPAANGNSNLASNPIQLTFDSK